MNEEHHIWRVWARRLHDWGLKSAAAWLLEATAPVHLLGAQLVYLGQPLLGTFWSDDQARSLAEVLEQPEAARAFVRFLREDASP